MHVRPEDTIAAFNCWCQGDICYPDPENPGRRTWPGEKDGAPHPREVSQRNTQEEHMPEEVLEQRQLRKWEGPVRDLLLHLVNTEKIRYRWVDGDHIALYPPDGVSRPFKVSPKRPAEAQVEYIQKQFMKPYEVKGPGGEVPYAEMGLSRPEETASVPEPTEALGGSEVARNAVLALAESLGVSLDGGVSEEDYLAMVSERDLLADRCERLENDLAEAAATLLIETEGRDGAIRALTDQRDSLLLAVNQAFEVLEKAL